MLKQAASRSQRSKGFKVKHFLQICLLLALSIWLLNQLRYSYDKKYAYDRDSNPKLSEKMPSKYEIPKLGRKDLPRDDETVSETESRVNTADLEEESEEIKAEDVEDGRGGGGDDEIDGHDQERADEEESEEVEDLIDEDDGDRDVGSEEQESDNANDDRFRNLGEMTSQEAREQLYKGDDASSSVEPKTPTQRMGLNIGDLRKVKVTFELTDNENVHDEDEGSSNLNSHNETPENQKSKIRLNATAI